MSAPAVSTLVLCAIEAVLETGGGIRSRSSPASWVAVAAPGSASLIAHTDRPGFPVDVVMVGIRETAVGAVGL